MFKSLRSAADPVALGAGYAIIILVFVAIFDTTTNTNFSKFFDVVSYKSVLLTACIYLFVAACTLASADIKMKKRKAPNVDGLVVDRLLSFMGLCIAIGGLPAYTQKTPVPFYLALLMFALIALSFAFAMWSVDKLKRGRNKIGLKIISPIFGLLSAASLLAAITFG